MNRHYVTWCLTVFVAAGAASAQDLYLTSGRLVDPATRTVAQGNLLILGGVIAGRPTEAPEGFEGQTVDVAGKWVLPGLHDLHTHSYGNQAPGRQFEFLGTPGTANRMLYAGVTGFLDLFSLEDMILGQRDAQRKGELPGADIFASGPCFTATGGHCTEYGIPTRVIDSALDAQREVAELAAKKPDVVKIVYHHTPNAMPSIDRATLEAAVKAATEHGLKTVIHVGTWQDARDSVEVGATAITHVPSAEVIPDDLVKLMVGHGTYSIPTMAVHNELSLIQKDLSLLDSPLLRSLTNETILGGYSNEEGMKAVAGWIERQINNRQNGSESVKKMADAGVPILTGTDAGNYGVFQGYSVHRELEFLVGAGLSPWQALAASTTVAGEFLDRKYGLREGDVASLVVLDASPVEDVRNTQKVHKVVHHGVVIDREGLLAKGSD